MFKTGKREKQKKTENREMAKGLWGVKPSEQIVFKQSDTSLAPFKEILVDVFLKHLKKIAMESKCPKKWPLYV